MTAKEYLQQLPALDAKIKCNKKLLEDIRSTMYIKAIDYSAEKTVTSGKNEASYIKKMSDAAELERKILKEISAYYNLKNQILKEIDNINNKTYINILYYRYLENKKLEEIALILNYSYNYIRRQHGHALLKFAEVNPQIFGNQKV